MKDYLESKVRSVNSPIYIHIYVYAEREYKIYKIKNFQPTMCFSLHTSVSTELFIRALRVEDARRWRARKMKVYSRAARVNIPALRANKYQ